MRSGPQKGEPGPNRAGPTESVSGPTGPGPGPGPGRAHFKITILLYFAKKFIIRQNFKKTISGVQTKCDRQKTDNCDEKYFFNEKKIQNHNVNHEKNWQKFQNEHMSPGPARFGPAGPARGPTKWWARLIGPGPGRPGLSPARSATLVLRLFKIEQVMYTLCPTVIEVKQTHYGVSPLPRLFSVNSEVKDHL